MVLFVSQHRTHQSYFAEPFSGLNEQNARIYRYLSNFPCTTERWWFFYMQTKFLFIYLRNWHLKLFFFFSVFSLFSFGFNTWKSQIYSGFNIKSRSKHLTLILFIYMYHYSSYSFFFLLLFPKKIILFKHCTSYTIDRISLTW